MRTEPHRATSSGRIKRLEVKTVLRHTPSCVVLLLVLASACSSGESPLEGDWYDSNGNRMLVVRGDVAELAYSRGPFSIDTDADPDQITLPPEGGRTR